MDLFKILGIVSIQNKEAVEALDETSRGGQETQGKLVKAFDAIGKSAIDGFKDKPMQDMGKSLTGLSKTVEDQRERLQTLKDRYVDLYTTQGKNSKEAKATAKEIEDLSKELDKNSAELAKAKKAADEYDKSIKDTGDTAEKTESKLSNFFNALGKGATTAGKAVAAMGVAVVAGFTAMVATAEGTREYRTELAKLTTTASETGTATDYIKDKWMSMSSVLGDSGAVTEGLNNLMTAGFNTEESLNGITQLLEGAAIKWKDTLKFEGLADGLQETLATGNAVGPFGELLERSGIVLDTFNEGLAKCTTEAQRQKYVMDTLSKTGLADVSKAYRESNRDIIDAERAQMRLTDTIAKFGAIAEPIISSAKNVFSDFLESLIPFVQQFAEKLPGAIERFKQKIEPIKTVIEDVKKRIEEFKTENEALFNQMGNTSLIDIFTNAFVFLAQVVGGVVTVLLNVTQWCIDNQELLTVIGIVVGSFATAWGLVTGAVTLWNSIGTIATAVTTGFGAAVNFLTSPITLVILAIGALIAVIVLCIKYWDEIKAVALKAWEGIKNAFSAAGKWFNEKVIQPIRNAFTNLWNGVKNAALNAWQGVKNAFAGVGSFFSGIWAKIRDTFTGLGTKIGDSISGAVRGAINGLISGAERTVNGFLGMINGAISIINKIPGVNISKVKLVSFTRLAEGGVVDEPTPAIFGEDGAEAVVPLEKNTGWIQSVAKQMYDFTVKDNISGVLNTRVVDLQQAQVSEMQTMNGKLDRIIGVLVQFFPQMLSAFDVKMYLDTGLLVAQTAGAMDVELGKIAVKKGRGR